MTIVSFCFILFSAFRQTVCFRHLNMPPVAKFFSLSSADRRLALEAAVFLGMARLAVVALPFRWVASALGRREAALDFSAASGKTRCPLPARRVAWAIRRTGRHTPWRSNCLAKSIAGRFMLRRRRIASTIYVGVAKDAGGEFEAHAWLTSGGVILNDDSDLERYTIVGAFTD